MKSRNRDVLLAKIIRYLAHQEDKNKRQNLQIIGERLIIEGSMMKKEPTEEQIEKESPFED